jgi:N-acyl-D-aspartate/D-glutamate deacylase
VFTWEQAITLLTWRPAQVFGFPHRGVLREGNVADVVVFDPDRVAPCLPYAAHDLPAGGTRLVQEAEGIHATVVAGQTLLRDGKFTEARPGRLLRAGA